MLPSWLCSPPPDPPAEFPWKLQLISVGLLATLHIPPPLFATEFPLKRQLISVGLLPELYIPPPLIVYPLPVNLKPTIKVSGPSPLVQDTGNIFS